MLTILSVLKSGGKVYDAEWVRKLRDGVARHLPERHRFVCLSDVEVPCERIPLQDDWSGWWSKIEMFREGVITGPTLYLDLDTVVCGKIVTSGLNFVDFAMLRNFWVEDMVGSGVMWFSGDNVPTHIYDKFKKQPDAYTKHYERNRDGSYIGDQAFIWDTMARSVEFINDYLDGIYSYKMHCKSWLPKDASIICFHGQPRPSEVDTERSPWMKEHWC